MLTRYAFNCSVADVADRTLANRKMIVNVAQRIPAARIAGKTRIYAERINALLVTRAFVVRVTFRPKSRQWRDWNCTRNDDVSLNSSRCRTLEEITKDHG